MFKCLIYRREALLNDLVLDPGSGSDHWLICCDPVVKLCQRSFPEEVFFGVGVEPLSVIGYVAERLKMIQDPYLSLDLVQLDLALGLFFFAMSVLVPKLPSTVKFIPHQCNMICYPADVIVSGVALDVVVVKVLLL
jgi:hypothetical protein